MTSWEDRFEKKPRRTVLNVGLSAIAICAVLGVAAWGISTALYVPQQAGRVMQKTLDADNVIANYEWFKRQYQDVQAIGVKLTVAKAAQASFEASAGPRDGWRFDDRQEWNRLNGIVLGLQGQRASMVAEYNARTQMANRDLFRTGDLPSHLE